MKPSKEVLKKLNEYCEDRDHEGYHVEFDALLEKRLMELDPEWMETMKKVYEDSDMARWCA